MKYTLIPWPCSDTISRRLTACITHTIEVIAIDDKIKKEIISKLFAIY